MKILYFDCETGGLTKDCDLFQMAGIVDIDGNVAEEFNITSRPFPDSVITEEALKITGKTREQIMAYQQPFQAMTQLESIFAKYVNKFDRNDKFILAGHNVGFDLDKLIAFFEKNKNDYLGSWIQFGRKFDTLAVIHALQVAEVIPVLPNNKLETIAGIMKIELFQAHDAMSDIRATRAIGRRLIGGLQKINKK